MSNTTRLTMPYLFVSQGNGEITHNEALSILDAVCQGHVLDRDITDPSALTPATGDVYIVGPSSIGDWASKDNQIAYYAAGWKFIAPVEGMRVWVDDEDAMLTYTGGVWEYMDGRVLGQDFRHTGTSPVERYYLAGATNAAALTTGAPAINTLVAMPFICGRGGTLDRLAFAVTTVGGASSKARAGIYLPTSRTNSYPSARVVDGGEFDTSTVGGTGVKAASISVRLKPHQLYWLVYVAGTAAPTVRALNLANTLPFLGVDNAFAAAPGVGWTVAFTYAALPSTFPGSGTVLSDVPVPALGVRYSA